MHNRIPWLCGAIVSIAIVSACSPTSQGVGSSAAPVVSRPNAARVVKSLDAGVDINCHGAADRVTITLDNWTVVAQPGDQITFKVKGTAHADNLIQVTPKRPQMSWPLDSLSYTARPGASTTATVKPLPVNGTYGYNISFRCVRGQGGEEISGVIDPDIIISGGTTKDTTQN